MQRHKTKPLWCEECERNTRHSRDVTAMGCGDLFMVLLTLGLWLLVRTIWVELTENWYCDQCGDQH